MSTLSLVEARPSEPVAQGINPAGVGAPFSPVAHGINPAGMGVPSSPVAQGINPAGMGAPSSPVAQGFSPAVDLPDLVARVVIGGLFLSLAIRIGANFLETRRPTGLLLLISELLVVILMIVRRPALSVDRSWQARLVATLSVLGPPLLRPILGPGFLPEAYTAPLSACGLAIIIAGKLALGRSFGLMPAHRGLVSSGPYRWVRHPIYLGYLLTHLAFLAAHPTLWNVTAIIVADTALIVRALYEERTLAQDAQYGQYQQRVGWRVVPGLF